MAVGQRGAALSWNDPTVQGAAIGVVGTIVGVIIAFLFSAGRDWLRERRDRRRIGTILYQELFDQAQAVALCGSYVNAFNLISVEEKRSRIQRIHLDFHAPADPVVFEGLVDRLHIMGASAGALVICYAATTEAKRFAESLPDELPTIGPDFRADMFESRTMQSWMRACVNIAHALDVLRPQVDGPSGSSGEKALTNLIQNLRHLSNGHTLRDNPTDDPIRSPVASEVRS